MEQKILIIGGVAGGAYSAARLRKTAMLIAVNLSIKGKHMKCHQKKCLRKLFSKLCLDKLKAVVLAVAMNFLKILGIFLRERKSCPAVHT